MKKTLAAILILAVFLIGAPPLPAATSDVTLAWDASIDEAYITAYELGWGTATGAYTNFSTAGLLHEKTVTLPDGKWFFAVRCKDARGITSIWSNEVSIVLKTVLAPPGNLRNTKVTITIPSGMAPAAATVK